MRLILFAAIFLLISFCRKNADQQPSQVIENGVVKINIIYAVDGQKMLFDTMLFRNAAGTAYCITSLHYYISSVRFIKDNGEQYTDNSIFYIDAAEDNLCLQFSKIPADHYTQLSLDIGIEAENNTSGSLPATMEHLNMAWPDAIGGGYHFLKLEGYYQGYPGEKKGYAIHLGTNPMLVKHLPIYCPLTVSAAQMAVLNLEMNVNEWFTNPDEYDFIKNGNYTMSDPILMKLISDNGKDVFTLH